MSKDTLILKNLPSQLETPHLTLRVPQAGDGYEVHNAIREGYEDLVYWLNWPTSPPSEEECELECRRHQAKWILRSDMKFLCYRKDTGELIGRLGYPDFQCVWETPLVAISYFISKPHQGQGYGTEAVNALSRYAFRFLEAKKIEIKCDVENVASYRIPEKLGFINEATQRGIWPKPGNALAEIRTYACFSEEELPHMDMKVLPTLKC